MDSSCIWSKCCHFIAKYAVCTGINIIEQKLEATLKNQKMLVKNPVVERKNTGFFDIV
jgi:hypothetical protein